MILVTFYVQNPGETTTTSRRDASGNLVITNTNPTEVTYNSFLLDTDDEDLARGKTQKCLSAKFPNAKITIRTQKDPEPLSPTGDLVWIEKP